MHDAISFDCLTGRGTLAFYRNLIEKAKCSIEERKLLASACTEFDQSYSHMFSDVIQIESIASAARHPRKVVWEVGVLMLAQLAQSNSVARTAHTNLATDNKTANRSKAMFYLSDQYPRSYCLDLLGAGVLDRSYKVASVAAWSALKLDLHELADPIGLRLDSIKKPTEELDLEMVKALLKHGFYEYYNENGYNIVVSFPERYPTLTVWPGKWLVKEGDVHTEGIVKLRERVRDSSSIDYCREWQWPET